MNTISYDLLKGKEEEFPIRFYADHDVRKKLIGVVMLGHYHLHYKVEWRYASAEPEVTEFHSLFNAVRFYNEI